MLKSLFDKQPSVNVQGGSSISSVLASILSRHTNGIVQIAPGIAKRILDEANFCEQRKFKESRAQEHEWRLANSAWNSGFPISFARLPDGELLLVDGQHRLTVISRHEAPVSVRVNIMDAVDRAEVRQLYIGFDQSTSTRSVNEVLNGAGVGEKLNISALVRDAAFSAIGYLRNNFEIPRSTRVGRAGLASSVQGRIADFPAWEAEILKYDHIYEVCDRAHRGKLLNGGTAAILLYTLKFQPAKAMDFWIGIARNDGLRKADPRHTLIQDFHTRSNNAGSNRQSVQAPALAWNAFFENRPLKIIKCIDGAAIRIAGTPFANGQVDE